MQYFIVSVDDNYVAPVPSGWYGMIDKKTLHRKKAYEMSRHLLYETENHMQMVFTDIITFPCFMVSEMIKEVMIQYSPFTKFVRVVLFCKERDMSMTYYIPFLDIVEYGEKTDLNGGLKEVMEDRVAAEVKNGDKTQVIMRMDLVESILRRNAIGVGLKEIMKWG